MNSGSSNKINGRISGVGVRVTVGVRVCVAVFVGRADSSVSQNVDVGLGKSGKGSVGVIIAETSD
jgi:hypothetical protein